MSQLISEVLFVHGLLGSQAFYSPKDYLAMKNVHTPDLIGYGNNVEGREVQITLEKQANMLVNYMKNKVGTDCWLVGHSVGGAIAMMAASFAPAYVKGVISVEGNFTLNDAFWCKKISSAREEDWLVEYQEMEDSPREWLEGKGIVPTKQRILWASEIIKNQTPQIVKAMANAVMKETADPSYLQQVQKVIHDGVPIYLLAGERSAAGWDVPKWVRSKAADYVVLPNVGHMMMLESPKEFCDAVSSFVDAS